DATYATSSNGRSHSSAWPLQTVTVPVPARTTSSPGRADIATPMATANTVAPATVAATGRADLPSGAAWPEPGCRSADPVAAPARAASAKVEISEIANSTSATPASTSNNSISPSG